MSTHEIHEPDQIEDFDSVDAPPEPEATPDGEAPASPRKGRKPRGTRGPKPRATQLPRAAVDAVYAAQELVAAADKKILHVASAITGSANDRELVTKILTGSTTAGTTALTAIAALIDQDPIDRAFTLIGSERRDLLAIWEALDSMSATGSESRPREDSALAKALTLAIGALTAETVSTIRSVVTLLTP